MHKVRLNEQTILVADGTLLSTVLQRQGIGVDHPCGGRGVCGKCRVLVDGREELSCRYAVHRDISVTVPQPEQILSHTGAEVSGPVTETGVFVLDIGTTTLALALVVPEEGRVGRVVTASNPQRVFGADVMSRIAACGESGPDSLQGILIKEINRLIRRFGLPPVKTLFVAGNTTMLHLLFGEDVTPLGVAPYTPRFLAERQEKAAALGLVGVEEVVSLPGLATFVGADIVAGLHYVGPPAPGKYRLLVDLGTNAEVALFSENTLLCTAAAAGPCFEGANISCGMSAVAGAVYAYSAAEGPKTVDGAPARGLCGTGLVDVMAALVADGTVDETGYMACGSFEMAPGVVLTQEDVRQFQLAKAAVYAAIMSLLSRQGIGPEKVEQLYISGGFSAGLNCHSAVTVGLLPAALEQRCTSIHNSSLLGTVKYACGDRKLSAWLTGEYVDLSADPVFSDLFIKNMLFSKEDDR